MNKSLKHVEEMLELFHLQPNFRIPPDGLVGGEKRLSTTPPIGRIFWGWSGVSAGACLLAGRARPGF